MAALEALDGELEALAAGRGVVFTVIESSRYIQAAGASYAQLALFLGVQVEEDVSLEDAGLQGIGAVHAGFFGIGGEHLDGTVLDGRIFDGGEGKGQADAVVCAQGGAVCGDPLTVHVGIDGILEEVVAAVGGFLGNHVHVALEDDALAFFHAGGGGDADDDVGDGAFAVLDGLKAVGLAPAYQILHHLFLVIGRAGQLSECVEILPDYFGF